MFHVEKTRVDEIPEGGLEREQVATRPWASMGIVLRAPKRVSTARAENERGSCHGCFKFH